MRKTLSLAIPGQPVPASRPRVRLTGGRAYAYHGHRYAHWLQRARLIAQSMAPKPPWRGPVAVTVLSYNAHAGADIDNLAKAALDVLNGTVINDDRQVVALVARKRKEPRSTTGTTIRVVAL